MGLPKASWLATLEDAAAHHSIHCLSTGLRHAVYARWSDATYAGDRDDNSRAWADEAVEHYTYAADALCTAAAAAAAACLPAVCAELVARSDEATARAAAVRAELAAPAGCGGGCCCGGKGGGSGPVKEKARRCSCGEKKEKAKCMCSVCVADRKGGGCTCGSAHPAKGGGAVACAQPVVCAPAYYACWPWYGC